MLKRVVDIASRPAFVSSRRSRLVITRKDGPQESSDDLDQLEVPLEDLGVLLLDNYSNTITQNALARLATHGAVMVVCDRRHMPVATMVPFSTHLQNVQRLREQIAMSKPFKKRTWQCIVQAKIQAQAANLDHCRSAQRRLVAMAANVKSGDTSNAEGQAARVYWRHYLPDRKFRRVAQGTDGNGILDYGYGVLRSTVARAIVGSGLHPALGVYHSNRANAFCLADDLMEPLRPFVDRAARPLLVQGATEVTPEVKRALLSVLSETVQYGDDSGPLFESVRRLTASFAARLSEPSRPLVIPAPLWT